jgi:carbonic anhydrase
VVTCSDSRVPAELIFNQLEPGKIFVIRVAGNIIADASVAGSVDYAVSHLKVASLIILAHTDCGAVKAYLAGGHHEGEVGKLLDLMKLKNKDIQAAIEENMDIQVAAALRIDSVRQAIQAGTLKVYGMMYDLESGTASTLSVNGKKA